MSDGFVSSHVTACSEVAVHVAFPQPRIEIGSETSWCKIAYLLAGVQIFKLAVNLGTSRNVEAMMYTEDFFYSKYYGKLVLKNKKKCLFWPVLLFDFNLNLTKKYSRTKMKIYIVIDSDK